MMEVPLQLSFRDVSRTRELEDLIRDRVAKLEKFCDHIIACRVAVERPHRHPSSGSPYRVRIDVTVPPGHEIAASKEPGDMDLHADVKAVIRSAFDAAERQVKEVAQRQRDQVKSHEEPRALIVRLFADEGYGFLRPIDSSEEIYFHRNAVLDDDFDRLAVGTQVRFNRTLGQEGPQATTVKIVDKPGERSQTEDLERPEL